jgi:RsiW-degrading membrane proteinase PrsW (M82 family)
MNPETLLRAPVGLLPVLVFLTVLVYMDSYKLVSLRIVLTVIFFGCLTAVAAYFINPLIMERLDLAFIPYARDGAPLVEETLKALVMVYLFRTSRIGFLVDAAILGFAVGTGFALLENFFYLQSGAGSHMGVWIVRGFGTAIMHGGTTAVLGIMAQTLTERSMRINPVYYLPGLLAASVLHAIYNHFPGTPILTAVGTLITLPPLLALVFKKSADKMHDWLELDFDADASLIEMISSHEFSESKIGRFLSDLRTKFEGPVVADMLCYLRIYTELAIRAKGVLMMRENGLDAPVGERTREKFEELRYLEKSIGKTGCLAMRPFLHMERKDLWQLNVLSK